MSSLFFSPLKMVGGAAVGVGVGGGIATVIEPILRELANEGWAKYQTMPLQAVEAAQLVASGERALSWGQDEAVNVGVNAERFQALVDMIDQAPDLSTLFDLLHRGLISEADFREGARKGQIEPKWLDPLVELAQRILSPAEAANAWQQGYMSEAAASAEAELSGVSPARSAIQRQLAGLPPGPETALTMLRRGIIDVGEFQQMIVEGNTKLKYADEYLALEDRILNATDAAGLWLRGWLTEAQAKAIGALNGYDGEAMELLYKNRGRPATVRQAHIGFARGGRLPEAGNDEEQTIRRSVEQSNIRSEWFDILYSQRFTYPSAFVVRALAQDGTFPPELTETILVESGWRPEWAQLAAQKWGGNGAGPSTKWADRARSRLFTALHNDYVDLAADEAVTREGLTRVGATGAEQDAIISLWEFERQSVRRELTQAQILKLFRKAIWPREQAQAALEDMGMEAGDAADLLDSV